MKKMQAQLNKQYKMDKKMRKEKQRIKEAERMERDEELREQIKKLSKDLPMDYTFCSGAESYASQPSPSPPPQFDMLSENKKAKDSEFYYGRFM